MQQSIALKDLEPNPYRGWPVYTLQRKKIDALKESIQTTGLWPRLMARPRPKGKFQIPYGHHLKQALVELFAPDHQVPVQLQEFSDAQMFQMMARENMTEWETTPVQDLATVRELLKAIKRGEINLPKAKQGGDAHPYLRQFAEGLTLAAIGRFLGWIQPDQSMGGRSYWITSALELIDAHLLQQKEIDGLNELQVIELIGEISRRKRNAEQDAREAEERAAQAREAAKAAKSAQEKQEARDWEESEQEKAETFRQYAKQGTRTIINEIAPKLREGSLGTKEIRARVSEILPQPFPEKKKLLPFNQFAHELTAELNRVLGPNDLRLEKLRSVSEYRSELDSYAREMLVGSLVRLGERVTHWIERFDPKTNNGQTRPPVKSAGPRQLKS